MVNYRTLLLSIASIGLLVAHTPVYAVQVRRLTTLEERVAARRASRSRVPTTPPRIVRNTPKKIVRTTPLTLAERAAQRRQSRMDNRPVPAQSQVIAGVNMERAKMGLAPLTYNAHLETAAQLHAKDMLKNAYFSHTNLEGQTSGYRIQQTGYGVINAQRCRCSYKVSLGENIAKGQDTVDEVILAWMNSQSHREAILSSLYNEIGVGIADDIWVLNFGGVEITKGRNTQ